MGGMWDDERTGDAIADAYQDGYDDALEDIRSGRVRVERWAPRQGVVSLLTVLVAVGVGFGFCWQL